jgi:hypothetical protein
MLGSLTATGVVAAAGDWTTSIQGPVLIVVGLVVILGVAGWATAKFSRRGGKGRKK